MIYVLFPIYLPQPEWQAPLTKAVLRIMRETTSVPFKVICVERATEVFRDDEDVDHWLLGTGPLTKDLNAAIDLALSAGDAKYLIHTANDIVVRPGWLEALLEVFDRQPDAGVATLAADELKMKPMDQIFEGIYGPLMMFRAAAPEGRGEAWEVLGLPRFDSETFPNIFSDSDLIMRFYATGVRSYRNWRVMVNHLNQLTWDRLSETEKTRRFDEAKAKFTKKHEKTPILIFRALVEGHII